MKVRTSTKIALAFVTFGVVTYGGYHVITERTVMRESLPSLFPAT